MPPMGPPGGARRGAMSKSKPKNTKAAIKRLFSYLNEDKAKIGTAFLCVLISAAANLAGTYMLKPIIDGLVEDVSAAVRIQALAKGVAAMAAIYLSGVAATYLQSRIMIGVSQKALKSIRNDLFRKLQKLPVRYFDTHTTGDVMSRFTNDVDTIGEMLNSTLVQLFSGIINLTGTLALMLYTNIPLTITTIVMTPIMAGVGGLIASKSRRYFTKQQAALGEVNGYIEETVTGQKVVKVFNHEDKVIDEFGNLNDNLRNTQVKAQFLGGIMGPCMNAMGQINYTLTATVGSIITFMSRAGKGLPFSDLGVGGLAVFVNFSRQFSRPINELSMQLTTVMSALAGAERVFDVMDCEPERNTGKNLTPEHIRGDVVVENVTFGYNPDKTILKNVSIYAHPGQKIALVGSTGAGKTTITNLITRFYNVDSGKITIDGIDIKDINLDCLRPVSYTHLTLPTTSRV